MVSVASITHRKLDGESSLATDSDIPQPGWIAPWTSDPFAVPLTLANPFAIDRAESENDARNAEDGWYQKIRSSGPMESFEYPRGAG